MKKEKNATILIEAESFKDLGGWVIDQQFMDYMGSPFLLAHGMGIPVKDAITKISFPETEFSRCGYVPVTGRRPGKMRLKSMEMNTNPPANLNYWLTVMHLTQLLALKAPDGIGNLAGK